MRAATIDGWPSRHQGGDGSGERRRTMPQCGQAKTSRASPFMPPTSRTRTPPVGKAQLGPAGPRWLLRCGAGPRWQRFGREGLEFPVQSPFRAALPLAWDTLKPFIAATIPTIGSETSRIKPTYSTVPCPRSPATRERIARILAATVACTYTISAYIIGDFFAL